MVFSIPLAQLVLKPIHRLGSTSHYCAQSSTAKFGFDQRPCFTPDCRPEVILPLVLSHEDLYDAHGHLIFSRLVTNSVKIRRFS